MTDYRLQPYPGFPGIAGQLLLVILDGVGLYRGHDQGYGGNAFDLAATPNLDRLFHDAPVFMKLKAHGAAVGLPSDRDMWNSEVGHNAIGAGRIFEFNFGLVIFSPRHPFKTNGSEAMYLIPGKAVNNYCSSSV